MKKIIFLIIFKASAFSSFSLDTIPSVSLSRQDYLQKSKNQKTTADILRYGGGALAVTGLLLLGDDIGGMFDPNDDDNTSTATVLICAGAAVAIISIPFRNAARKNEQRAMSLSIKNERIQILQKGSYANKFLPVIRLSIPL